MCAGKKIHEVLLDAGNVGVGDIVQKYLKECQLMLIRSASPKHHPVFRSVFVPQLPTPCAGDGET